MRRNTIFSKAWLQKYFCSPLTKIYVRETTNILRIFQFTKVFGGKTLPSYRLLLLLLLLLFIYLLLTKLIEVNQK